MKKFLIDGSAPAVDFDGKSIAIGDAEGKIIGYMTLADYISQALGQDRSPQHDTLKCFDIGIELRRKKKAEVDESDLTLVKSVVKACELPKLIKAQLIRLLDAVKEVEAKPAE